MAYVQGKGSVWLPPTLAAIISERKKVAGAAATTRHATNSSHGEGGIMWKFREAMCHLNSTKHYQLRWRVRNKVSVWYNHERNNYSKSYKTQVESDVH